MRIRTRKNRLRKLTLSMGAADIRALKGIAARDGMSVSAWLRSVVRASTRRKPGVGELTANVQRMVGLISLPKGKTDRQLLEEALEEKYGPLE